MVVILEEQRCIPTCVSATVRGGIEAKCPGMIGSVDIESETMELIRCICSCHAEDSEDLNEEQEHWFEGRIASVLAGPIRPWPWTHHEFNHGVPFRFSEEFS